MLDSSWHYQSIQYRIVENPRQRNAGRQPAGAHPRRAARPSPACSPRPTARAGCRPAWQMRRVIASQPGFASVPAHERREAYEQLAITGMFMATTQMGLKAKPDAALAKSSRDAARGYLQQFLKGDVDRLTLSDEGLVLR
ncbi:DUF6683 family protein [Rubrivivax gelatinosus]|uniref:DUF6683 family protein n=1 Tax=Rubrivivax gelatinosus TaxID=28068 RepID=UPI001F5BBEE6|nr:DUF6683 family protein [Rubrivivax gelatinosus]